LAGVLLTTTVKRSYSTKRGDRCTLENFLAALSSGKNRAHGRPGRVLRQRASGRAGARRDGHPRDCEAARGSGSESGTAFRGISDVPKSIAGPPQRSLILHARARSHHTFRKLKFLEQNGGNKGLPRYGTTKHHTERGHCDRNSFIFFRIQSSACSQVPGGSYVNWPVVWAPAPLRPNNWPLVLYRQERGVYFDLLVEDLVVPSGSLPGGGAPRNDKAALFAGARISKRLRWRPSAPRGRSKPTKLSCVFLHIVMATAMIGIRTEPRFFYGDRPTNSAEDPIF
jgi:hypothetical protein